VTFAPVPEACVDGCEWASGGIWEVSADHHGDFGSAQAIAFAPSGPPWFVSDDTVWRLGVPGAALLPAAAPDSDEIHQLAVADDGVVWVASDLGLHSFDSETWTAHWTDAALTDVDVTSAGAVVAVGGGRTGGRSEGSPVTVVRLNEAGVEVEPVDVLPARTWPVGIVAAPGGEMWVGVIESGYVPTIEGQSLLARFDGEDWDVVRPLGPDADVAAWSLASGPDGSLWASLWASRASGEGFESYLAQHGETGWSLHVSDQRYLEHRLGLQVSHDGTAWFPGGDASPDGPEGMVAFDGTAWLRYLEDAAIGPFAIAPDGTVYATTIPGFDEDGRLFAIRQQR
jgi:hypothetical protein